MKKQIITAALAMLMVVGSTTIGFASGSIGHGNMSVFEGGQLVDKLSGQNPIAESSLLVCDGKCIVKSKGISLVAADQSKFAVQNEDSVFNLYVQSGKIEYVINDNSRQIAFHTPDGTYTVADVIFNASSSSVVKGSVEVTGNGKTEITVTEGRLVFATGEGMKTVDANNKIILAVLPEEGGSEGGGIGTTTMVTAAVVTAAVVGAVIIYNNNDDDDDDAAAIPAPEIPEDSPKPRPPIVSPNN